MTGPGNEAAGKISRRFWAIYDVVERAGTGGVIGWFLTFPVMWAAGLLFGPEAGINGWAGDNAWFGTIPLGIGGWLWLRRGRPGGWLARAAFGGLVSLPACIALSILYRVAGDTMLGYCILGVPAGAVLWPLGIWALRRWTLPPAAPPQQPAFRREEGIRYERPEDEGR